MKKFLFLMFCFTLAMGSTALAAVGDVSNHWAREYIEGGEKAGWLDLKQDGNYYPANDAQRQEAVYMIYSEEISRASKLDFGASVSLEKFSDAASIENKYRKAFEVMAANGVINGYEDGTIRPLGAITRAETAVIMSQMLADRPLTMPFYGFADAQPQWAAQSIERCARAGLITGYGDKTFRPSENVSRAEIAVMVSKLAEFNEAAARELAAERASMTSTETTEQTTKTAVTEETTEATTLVNESTTEGITNDMEKVEELIELINRNRNESGTNTVELDKELCAVAFRKAKDMYENNYYQVGSPNLGYVEEMLATVKYRFLAAEELVVSGVALPVDVIGYWENNDEMKDLYLEKGYNKAGAGFCKGKWCVIYVRDV